MTRKRFEEYDNGFEDKIKNEYFETNKEIVDRLNALYKENEKLRKAVDNCQFRTLDLLDYIKEKETVTHQEIKDWWNSKVIK